MMKHSVYMVVLMAAGVVCAEPPLPTELMPELRKGGYVLFIRHPKTNPDQADTDPLNLDNVKAQRQLSDEGRKRRAQWSGFAGRPGFFRASGFMDASGLNKRTSQSSNC